jgi:hypothetical protein
LGLGFSFWQNGSAMFSPGALSAKNATGRQSGGFEAHAAFENECHLCHAPLETIQADLCTRCHTNIMQQVTTGQGTHARISQITECRACHPDHHGRDFDPTAAAFALFDHNQTNFTLTWHQVDYDLAPMTCENCHSQEDGFTLQTIACEDCHANYDPGFMAEHLLEVGDNCLACHDGSGNIANFDHSTTRFPLAGQHTEIQCVGCHTDGQFGTLERDCVACHAEPEIHAGFFSSNCEACHTPVDWSAMASLVGGFFDHFEKTQFSLNRHQQDYAGFVMNCAACHTSPDGLQVTFDLRFCIDCHTAADAAFMDEHQTQFGVDCLSCHDGIDRMNDFDHAQVFPLEGAHLDAECTACHADWVFSGTPVACAACHSEPEIHAGIFGLQCESCHSTTAWSPAQMVEHTFPLDHGEQGLVACETCHVDRYTEYTCYGCHEHQPGEIISEHREEGISEAELADCMACHPDGREHDD